MAPPAIQRHGRWASKNAPARKIATAAAISTVSGIRMATAVMGAIGD